MNKRVLAIFFFALTYKLVLASDGSQSEITITSVIESLDSLTSTTFQKKVFVGAVINTTESADSGIIGSTRIGIKKYAQFRCNPLPSIGVKRSLIRALDHLKIGTNDPSSAAYSVDITILEYYTTETTQLMRQTLTAKVKLDVTLTDPLNASKVRKFTVESEGQRIAFDTTKFAQSVLHDALISSFNVLIKTLAKY